MFALTPSDLRLPFDDWRTHQAETITHLAASRKKYRLLQAPTGSGKSGIAVGLARILGARKTAILCSTKQLQQQYLESFSELQMVRGRGNFDCLVQESTAEDAPCTLFGPSKCRKHSICPYYVQLYRGLSAEVSVHNYAYWLLVANGPGWFGIDKQTGNNIDLLICDEAHAVEDQLRKQVQVEITNYILHRFDLGLPTFAEEGEVELWKDWARTAQRDIWSEARYPDGEEEEDEWGSISPNEIRHIQSARNLIEKLGVIARMDDDWIIERKPGRGVEFKPVWVAEYAKPMIFRHAKNVVLMSATILDAEQFGQGLGLTSDEIDFFDVPSTFPKERRPIIVRPVARVSYGMSKQETDTLVAAVDRILDDHPNEKGLIHTANYQLAQTLKAKCQGTGRMLSHKTADRTTTLEAFRESVYPLVLVSPSFNEGVDLPYDDCRFIVICKLPFANKEDKQIKRRMKIGPDGLPNQKGQNWYMWNTACKMVQSAGRGMRSADDKCTTYVLDANYKWFSKAVRRMLPGYWLEAIQEEDDIDWLVRQALNELR